MHTVKEGPADRSYGLQVAQLAGVPKLIIEHAKQRLQNIEHIPTAVSENQTQNDMFQQRHPLVQALDTINPDELSPKQALDILYQLQSLKE